MEMVSFRRKSFRLKCNADSNKWMPTPMVSLTNPRSTKCSKMLRPEVARDNAEIGDYSTGEADRRLVW